MTIYKYSVTLPPSLGKGVDAMRLQNQLVLAVLCGSLLSGLYLSLAPVPVEAAASSEKKAEQALVSINKASANELESVRGIGPMLAKRIIEDRQAKGRFEQLEDLVRVPGIGQAKLERIKSQLTL